MKRRRRPRAGQEIRLGVLSVAELVSFERRVDEIKALPDPWPSELEELQAILLVLERSQRLARFQEMGLRLIQGGAA